MDFNDLETELKDYLSKEPRKDPEFRYAIAANQFGSLVSHMTHDPALNPTARQYKTEAGEQADLGHAILQLIIYGISRGLHPQDGVLEALKALEDRDWQAKRPNLSAVIQGIQAVGGCVTGVAVVSPPFFDHLPMGCILVVDHVTCEDITPHLNRIAGIVTNQGGMLCHAAIVAREKGIPCIVGCGDATDRVAPGQMIEIGNGRVLTNFAVVQEIN